MPPQTDGTRARIPTVHKMLQVLRAFTPETPSWKLLELSRQLEWDAGTTHRFVKALVEIGMLEIDGDLQYHVGPLPQQLAAVAASVEPAWPKVLARLPEIANRTELTTQVALLDADAVSIIASHESVSPLKAAASLGARLPLHATAGGKSILAQLSDEQIKQLLPETLERFTEQTIVDRQELLHQIEVVRTTKIAFVDSELSPGLSAAATAIPRNWFGTAPAALVCAGLARELVPEQWAKAEATLLELAADLASAADARDWTREALA